VPRTPRSQWLPLVVAAGAALALTLVAPVLSAHADPVYPSSGEVRSARAAASDKSAQIAVVQGRLKASHAQLDELQSAAEAAAERYNLARILLRERTEAARLSASRAAAARKTADAASDRLGQTAAAAYRQGGSLGQLEPFLSSGGPQQVLERAAAFQLISGIRHRISQDAGASSVVAADLGRQAARARARQLAGAQEAESARASAAALVDQAAAETAAIQKRQQGMLTQLASLRDTSLQLEQQRQSGLQAEAAAQIAEQARADARSRSSRDRARGGSATGSVFATPAPFRGHVSPVVAFADGQIGEPYLWGAAGPGSWDCSGLTMMAWRQAGVSLSHYTGYQWAETSRVPLADLQPGDLVFFGASGPTSHHVGLYAGGGRMIEAPRAGLPVRYASIWRSDLIAYGGRP
jgi:peptidoglycan DL-endopeptidase CwlO